MDINVRFVPKEQIYPAFGYMHYSADCPTLPALMEIREGLSRFEICSLLVHEFGHMDDVKDKEGLIHRELESISMSIFYPILGTVMIAIKSLSKDRFKWYWKRWKEKK